MKQPDAIATVVIPCLDRRDSLARTLHAVDQQSMRSELRVIVVDNGSTDGSVEVARRNADDVLMVHEPGSGPARNEGLTVTQTKFMLTLDSDCYPVDDRWAERHINALKAAPKDVVASSGSLQPLPTTDRWGCRADITPHPAFADGEPLYAVAGNGCYRTTIVKELGGFPLVGADDAALGHEARRRGYRFIWTPEAAVYHVNPTGLLGYYRHMRKIGFYAAELDVDDGWLRLARRQSRHALSMVRVARNGAGREALAGVVAVAAQTVGAARGRRSRRARRGGGR
jgi:glycosyltransferase involved in cell wall biosynthesis